MVLNTAQTWHQLRPGEIRNNCGGCHAHSQKATDFSRTLAASPGCNAWDLVNSTPLLTSQSGDESKRKWDEGNRGGLRFAKSEAVNVEYWRDIRPILQRSGTPCHTSKLGDGALGAETDGHTDAPPAARKPAGNLPPQFRARSQGGWELKLAQRMEALSRARVVVAIRDKQGNLSRIERTFSVGAGQGF
jgi:hypothetical protein